MEDLNQTTGSNVNIDSLRGEHESNTEWRLRRKFLELNSDSLNRNRLMCLSRCFVNIVMYGCSYPEAVMNEVNERSGGILNEVKADKKVEAKQKYAASFVKASSGSGSLSTINSAAFASKITDVHQKAVLTSGQSERKQGSAQVPRGLIGNQTKAYGNPSSIQAACEINKQKSSFSSPMCDFGGYWAGSETMSDIVSDEEDTKRSTTLVSCRPDAQSPKIALVSARPNKQNTKTELSKQECLIASQQERNPVIQKIRKLAYEIQNLKTVSQNAMETINSAGNRVPVLIDFTMKQIPSKPSNTFLCHVLIEGVEVASEKGPSIKQAKNNACEAALKVVKMPKIEIIQSGNTLRLLKGSVLSHNQNPYQLPSSQPEASHPDSAEGLSFGTMLPIEGTSVYKESNMKAAGLKRKWNEFRSLEEFIIVEQMDPTSQCGAINILRQSADFSRMLLEFEFFPQGMATRCIVKIEDRVMADVVGATRSTAKATACAQCLKALRSFCWVMKTKQAVDSNTTISKDEIQKEIELKSNQISCDNIGSKMLQKMGWSGGGVGKDGTGIAEPVSLVAVLNRQGLGLGAASGITNDFRRRIKEVVQNYASSGNQEDLVFSNDFDIEERKIIHDECRKLGLRSTSRGKGQDRYLCVSRKRSANQLFEHVQACGGETAKYKLLPPGTDLSNDQDVKSDFNEDNME